MGDEKSNFFEVFIGNECDGVGSSSNDAGKYAKEAAFWRVKWLLKYSQEIVS